MRDFIELTKALSDESRVRILLVMGEGELCVCQLTELLGLAPSTVSKHLSILRHARLVEMRKDGKWIMYSLAPPDANSAVKSVLQWARESLNNDPVVSDDRKRIKKIKKLISPSACASGGKEEK